MSGLANPSPSLDPGGTLPVERLRETLRERAAGLASLGYRADDAAFLAAAALLGGYFLRRQYRAFGGRRSRSAETRMLRLAAANGHASAVVGKSLYRLGGASLHRALGCEGGRARWGRARRAVKQQLLALDYFLAFGDGGRWLLSEADKAGYFSSLGIPADKFPASARNRGGKPRIFADGFPLQAAVAGPAVVGFCYAHAGAAEGGMLRRLERHEPLAAALEERGIACAWTVLADSPAQFPRLRHAWRRWRSRLERDWTEREYFELRLAVEKRLWKALSRESIERYVRLRAEVRTDGIERRYNAWIKSGAPSRQPGDAFAASCTYREALLDHDYSAADAMAG